MIMIKVIIKEYTDKFNELNNELRERIKSLNLLPIIMLAY